MKTQTSLRWLLLASLPVIFAGCATYPISQKLRQESAPVGLAMVQQHPEDFTGKTVIWGGRILRTVNDTNGATIYFLALSLDRHEDPQPEGNSEGRFIGRSRQFLDPALFRRGRLATVAGTIAGVKVWHIQKAPYTYPVLDLQEIHLWPDARERYWEWVQFSPNAYYWGAYGSGLYLNAFGDWGEPDDWE
jgi:outer membrane lipoprotein